MLSGIFEARSEDGKTLPGSVMNTKLMMELTTHSKSEAGMTLLHLPTKVVITCRVFVRPPGGADAKFHSRSEKGVFLGFPKNAAKNVAWCDPETNTIKIAKHACFDKGMNDTPMHRQPPDAHA